MAGCRGCSTQEEVEAATAERRFAIKQWQKEQLVYDREAHGIFSEPEIIEEESEEDNFWNDVETLSSLVSSAAPSLVGTAEPQPQSFEKKKDEDVEPVTKKTRRSKSSINQS